MVKVSVFFLMMFLVVSCKQKRSRLENSSETKLVSAPLNLLWQKNRFKVCWLSPETDMAKFKKENEDFITDNLLKVPIYWTGWGTCDSNQNYDVRIFIYDNPGIAGNPALQKVRKWRQQWAPEEPGFPDSIIGKSGVGEPANMILNSSDLDTAEDFSAFFNGISAEAQRKYLISGALHQAMVVLGFVGEDNHSFRRNGGEPECYGWDDEGFDTDALRIETKYGAKSIMNACYYMAADPEGPIIGLSKNDILGLRKIFFQEEIKLNAE